MTKKDSCGEKCDLNIMTKNDSSEEKCHVNIMTKKVPKEVKCVLVGDGGVGKTSLVLSYTTGKIKTSYEPTCFDDYLGKKLYLFNLINLIDLNYWINTLPK